MTSVLVDTAGLLTTVQDSGRTGHQAAGVPVSGPMDWWSLCAANLAAGNEPSAAALEVTVSGPALTARSRVAVAIAGARFELRAGTRQMVSPALFTLEAGERLSFGRRVAGCRAYVAFAGGIDVPRVLGSRSTDLRSGLGGIDGRAIRAGDVLPIGPAGPKPPATPAGAPLSSLPAIVRFIPHDDVGARATARFTASVLTVSPQSNRVGYRLEGMPQVDIEESQRLSRPAVMGLIQAPPSGGPILLMADAQPTGGYPILGVVVTADLPIAGQLAPGDSVRFVPCTYEEALAALAERDRRLAGMERRP